ncbi:hypothetical protein QOZ80_6AG0541830 [Eleusine coracana subsp. coracana]|nr:hypothetical protein QOZ80_6AG0541830 [Eleusine coracana subsp. coracana]
MASRMMAVILVCALLTWTPEAARVVGKKRGDDQVAVAGHVNNPADSGNIVGSVLQWEHQQRELIVGRRPRLVSFTRLNDVAPPSVAVAGDGGGTNKREVPGGPDPIHHPDVAPPTSSSSNP